MEVEFNFSDRPMTVLGHEKFSDIGWFVAIFLMVIIGTVKEHNKVGILLDGAGFTKVREDWTGVVTAGHTTRKLSKGDDRNF